MTSASTQARGITYKTLDASIQEVTGRHIEFIASQEVQDRDGDVIEVAGIDCTDFLRNPILLGDHNKEFILGKITKLWKERLADGPALLAKAELLPAGVSARADERYHMIKFGAAKGISIGFRSHAHEPTPTGYRYKSIELIEMSQVAVPSCPTCIITAKSAQQRRTSPHHSLEGSVMNTADEDEMYLEITDDFWTKNSGDDFAAMCARMLSAYEEMSSFKFQQLMHAQLSVLGPDASIADLVRGLTQQGVVPSQPFDVDMRSWTPELYDIDPKELAVAISHVVAEAVGHQTRAALNQALGRLD